MEYFSGHFPNWKIILFSKWPGIYAVVDRMALKFQHPLLTVSFLA
jgi:hypothetical protein